ncbi:MAG: transposase [Chitinophagaceae bacterium]|nr:transposase [Chitinophagaceae bacterium]
MNYSISTTGDNQQRIFFKPENYLFFLKKVRQHIQPHCDILAWCLMPNHFHFQVYSVKRTIATRIVGGTERNVLAEGIRNLLSSYLGIINKKTPNKYLHPKGSNLYDRTCFHYIHQNPVKAKLVSKMEDWEYSSFKDYCGKRNGSLVNQELAIRLLALDMNNFYEDSYRIIMDDDLKNIL